MERGSQLLNLNDFYNRYYLEDIFSKIETKDGSTILDLGSGASPYQNIYSKYFSKRMTADMEIRNKKLDVIANSEYLPFKNGSFDVVLFSEVIEHVPNHILAVSEISRILNAKGYLVITWPFIYQMHELPHDYRRITEYGMKQILENAGFEI